MEGSGYDEAYEFEAPQWSSLADDSDGGSNVDGWFEGRMDTPMKKAAEHRLLNGSDFEAEFGAPPQLDAAGSEPETNETALEDFSRNIGAGEDKAVAEEDGDYLRVSAADVEDAPAANEDTAMEAEENAAPAAAEGEEDKDEEEEPTVQTIEPAKKSKRRILNIVTDWARNIGSPKVAKRVTRARKGGDAGKSSGATAALAKKAIKKATKPPKGPKKASGKGPNVSKGPRTPTRSHRTKPITPRCMKRVSRASIGKGKILSTEEREMQELKQKREEMVKRRKLSSSSFKRLSNSHYTPQRSEKQLTIPKEFNFDPRGKNTTRVSSDGSKAKPVSTLPSRPNQHGMVLRTQQPRRSQPKLTEPKPFKFQERLAKQAKAQAGAGEPKPYIVLSTEEQALRDIASRQPFRARPVNSAVMNSAGDLGLPRVLPKSGTVPDDFEFKTEARTRPAVQQDEQQEKFSARAVPDFSKIRGLPVKAARPVTVPKPPATQLERRVFETKVEEPVRAPAFKAQLLPVGSPFKPTIESKHTVAEPFKRMESHRAPMETRQQKAAEAMQELDAARNFKANPMPVNEMASGIPFVRSKEPTEPEPFALESDALHRQHQMEIKQQELELERELREAAMFRATVPMNTQKPYQIQKSTAPLTEIKPFEFNLGNRMSTRKAFDKQLTKNQLEQARQQAKRQEEQELADQRELKQLRRKIVHQAKPVPQHRMMLVKHSSKPSTQPMTPEVARRSQRARALRA